MSQFHLPGPWTNSSIEAPASLAHHLRVRRIRDDEEIRVFDGLGQVANAKISKASTDKQVILDLSNIHDDKSCESPYPLVLIQGIAGGDKMDWIIEKAVELGVTRIQPIQTSRSVVKLDTKRAQKRLEHWQAITLAACEQSGRTVLPLVLPVESFEQALSELPQDVLPIMLTPRATLSLISIAKRSPGQGIALVIGPEGGLSDEEETLAVQKGVIEATLGKRILRTETAGIVAMSAVHTLWGGF